MLIYLSRCTLLPVIITLVNCFSVRVATGLQTVLTVAKLVAIIIIIFAGFVMMGLGKLIVYLYFVAIKNSSASI